MSQNLPKKSGTSQNAAPTDLSPETIQLFIETQKLKTQNEAKELEIRLKEMELNAKLAEQSMTYQNEYLRRRPHEHRKSLTRICYILIGLALVFFAFLGFLLYMGHKEFAEKFLSGLSYVVVSVLSFFAGKRKSNSSGSKTESDNTTDADVIQTDHM